MDRWLTVLGVSLMILAFIFYLVGVGDGRMLVLLAGLGGIAVGVGVLIGR